MSARLIAVEGLPGSGKTTAAQMAYDILFESGIEAELWEENSLDHPADFDGVAYLVDEEFEALRDTFPSMKNLEQVSSPFLDGYLVWYRKAMEQHQIILEPGLRDTLVSRDVYELTPDLHMKIVAQRWKDFVEDHKKDVKVFIFECSFIQNPVTFTMVKNNAPEDVIISYVQTLMEIVSPLDPVLLYMDQKDFRAAFLKVIEERPPSWYEGFEAYYTRQGYGLDHQLTGTEGVLRELEERVRLERRVFSLLPVEKYVVDNSRFQPASLQDDFRRILKEQDILSS